MVNVIREAGATIIKLGAGADTIHGDSLRAFGEALLAEAERADPPRLVIDLSQTEYIGSDFVELLVRAWRRLKPRNGTMALCDMQPFCLEVLELTRLSSLWPAYATCEEAVAALTTPANGGGTVGGE